MAKPLVVAINTFFFVVNLSTHLPSSLACGHHYHHPPKPHHHHCPPPLKCPPPPRPPVSSCPRPPIARPPPPAMASPPYQHPPPVPPYQQPPVPCLPPPSVPSPIPVPPRAPSPPATGTCPMNVLKLGLCMDVLSGLVHVRIGTGAREMCCPLIQGLADLDVALCLCIGLKARLLNLDTMLPIVISSLVNDCGKYLPSDYKCPPLP